MLGLKRRLSMNTRGLSLLIVLFVFWASVLTYAQDFGGEDIVDIAVQSSQDKLVKGKSTPIAIVLQIKHPWHINSFTPKEEFLIPTVLELSAEEGVSFGKMEYPEAIEKQFEFSETPLWVLEGEAVVYTTVTVPPDFNGNAITIKGKISYQACDDHTCLAPTEKTFQAEFPVAQPGETVHAINTELFNQRLGKSTEPSVETSQEAPNATTDTELSRTIAEKGLLLTFVVIFISGLALNLTPCVYPLIPITISYFGGQAGGKKGSLLVHAIIYILGMAITYSVLGVIAALTGSILGAWLQHPIVLLFIAAVMVALALSMFGLYEITVPPALANFAGQSKQGYFGTFFMGLTVGIIAAPCIGPFVLALFTYVGTQGDPVLGFFMFFVLALGLGIPFVLLAVFSGSLQRLPRSGAWMVWVRTIFGFILTAVAIYFLHPLIKNELWYMSLLAANFILAGIYLAWIEPSKTPGLLFPVVRNLLGMGFVLLGIFLGIEGLNTHIDARLHEFASQIESSAQGTITVPEIAWKPYSEEAVQQAVREGKPVFIDFYADWCIPCKELDKFTFTDERVIKLSKDFVNLKVDLTSMGDPNTQALKQQFNIKGVPTLVFLDKNGTEIPNTRIVGFIEADKLAEIMQSIVNNQISK